MRFAKRPWIAALLVVTALLIVLGAIYVAVVTRSSRELAEAVREAEASGDPLDLDKLAPPPAASEENAAVRYNAAFALLSRPPSPEWEDAFEALERGDTATFEGNTLTLDAAALSTYLSGANALAIHTLESGARRSRCNYDLDYSQGFMMMMPHLMKHKDAAYLLRVHARSLVEMGKPDDALAAVGTNLRVARGLGEDRVVIGELVRIACESIALVSLESTLSHGEPSEAACRALDRTLAEQRTGDELGRALVGERAIGLDVLHRARGGSTDLLASSGMPPALCKLMTLPLVRGYTMDQNAAVLVRFYTRFIEISRRHDANARADLRALEAELQRRSVLYFPVKELALSLRVYEKELMIEARILAARAALALRIHRLRHGAYPATLDALVPELMPAVPIDPFTQKPLVYAREGRGFAVYSVGPNGIDDGGPTTFVADPPTNVDDVGVRSKR